MTKMNLLLKPMQKYGTKIKPPQLFQSKKRPTLHPLKIQTTCFFLFEIS